MQNILFVCYILGLGGIGKYFVNLINSMSEETFNIDLLEIDFKQDIERKVCIQI